MSDKLFELLSAKGMGRKSFGAEGELTTTARDLTSLQIAELCARISQLLPRQKIYSPSPFMFVANTSLSGGPSPCSAPACRIGAVDDLGRFAALYADHVFLPDPFNALSEQAHFLPNKMLNRNFGVYVRAIHLLRPLIEAKLVSFIDNQYFQVCSTCFPKAMGEVLPFSETTVKKMVHSLTKTYLNEVKFSIVGINSKRISVRVSGPENLIPHGVYYVFIDQPEENPFLPDSMDDLSDSNPIPVPDGHAKLNTTNLIRGDIEETIYDLQRQNKISQQKNVGYLTNREIDFELLQLYNKKNNKQTKNHRRKSGLNPNIFSHLVPAVQNADLKKLVRLRTQETPAFQTYRESLSSALAEAKNENLSQNMLEEIYNDKIRPEIINLESAIMKSKKLLTKSLIHDLGIVAGAISIGMLAPYLPAAAGPLLGAIGGAFHAKRAFTSITKEFGDPPEALVGIRGDGGRHTTRAAMRAPRRALPRRRALCTNSKKPR
jgi:hypothetical protein